ncbi:MAG: transglycosylase SLT domain-containing protein [Deltaproteobacteria bacterium]|nr:transglycosylase SLT domain-containing protein [Deltaproteobacteria bacterium]
MRWLWLMVGVMAAAVAGCAEQPRPRVATAPAAVTTPGTARSSAATVEPAVRPNTPAGQFAQAHAQAERGDCRSAQPTLEALRTSYPALQDYVLLDLATCLAGTDPMRADEMLATLLATQPRSVLSAEAALARGRGLAARDPEAAGRLLGAARDDGDQDTAMRASLALADLARARSDRAAEAAHLQAARRVAPVSPLAREAKQRLQALRAADPSLAPRGAELNRELTLLMAEQDFPAAIVVARQILAQTPPGQQSAVLRQLAEAQRGADRLDDAVATLRTLVRQAPQSDAAADAQYRLAALLWNRDRNAEARREFELYLARYRGQARSAEVLYALARIAQGDGDTTAAIAGYRRLIDAYPSAPQAREARWRIGWIAYQAGDYRAAASAFDAAAQGRGAAAAPDAVYWEGRALQRAGERAAAAARYREVLEQAPGSYYATWAARRLGTETAVTATPAPPPRPAIGAPPPGSDPYHWMRARELVAAGLQPLARRELQQVERDHRGDGAVAAALPAAYQAAGGYRDALRLATARGSGDPDLLYPLAFWPQVSRNAAAQQVDPLLVLALMRQESLFDPAARSPADARGLMQLLPGTAARVAQARGEAPPDDLSDPDANVALGTAYLATLLRENGGDPLKALAAYNGGEPAVARSQAQFGQLDGDEWVESITFRETRDYVKKVMGNHRRYQQLYAR